jgi:hypothetical protein
LPDYDKGIANDILKKKEVSEGIIMQDTGHDKREEVRKRAEY